MPRGYARAAQTKEKGGQEEDCQKAQTVSLSTDLLGHGIGIQDDFASSMQIHELVECLHMRRARGEFAAARIGAGESLQRRGDIRGDSICWLNPPLLAAEAQLLESFEQLRLQLNQEAFLGLFELELHYAAYPAGSGYARHVDQARGNRRRKVSMVLYLNREWTPAMGGELRLFGEADRPRDVQPLAGRLVCFLTEGREHCVLPARKERLSITGWFGTRD
jgi:SM-20-related protein